MFRLTGGLKTYPAHRLPKICLSRNTVCMSSSIAVMEPIGVIHSPYSARFGTPRQPTVTEGVLGGGALQGKIELFEGHDYENALDSLEGFDYIWVIAWLNRCVPSDKKKNKGWSSRVRPRMRSTEFLNSTVGLFSTRAPHRPNPIGLSALRLTGVDKEKRILHVDGLDFLDGTPVLDIKPYIPVYDSFPNARIGWLAGGLSSSLTTPGVESSGEERGTSVRKSVNAPDYSPHTPPHKSALQKLCHERYNTNTSFANSDGQSIWKDPLYIWSDGFKLLTVQLPDKEEFSFPFVPPVAAADTPAAVEANTNSSEHQEETVTKWPASPAKARKRHEQEAAREVMKLLSERKSA